MANMKKTNKQQIHRYIDGLYHKSEVSEILETMRSAATEEDFEDLVRNSWEESLKELSYSTTAECVQYKSEAALLLKRIKGKSYWRKVMSWTAACIAIVVLIGLGITFHESDYSSISYVEISTSFGEKKSCTLPDNTIVDLNACTTVRFPQQFTGKERKVELEGEAYFRVKRDEKKPFVVSTGKFDVKVLGTSFNVKVYERQAISEVSVESGKVQVELPEASVRLVADEQMRIDNRTNEFTRKKQEHERAMAWLQSELHYDNTPLHDVLVELEQIYNCRIMIDPKEAHYTISGGHGNTSLHAVLQSIEYVTGLKYKREADYILLYK